MQGFNFESDFASEHERLVRQVIPGYEHLFLMARALLRAQLGKQANLLVAGAGGGMEILTFGAANPGWQIMGVDPSERMLSVAREKVERHGLADRVRLHHGYVHELPTAPLYDGATCVQVTHILPDDGSKQALLTSIRQHLKPGAPFILADPFGAAIPEDLLPAWRWFQLYFGRTDEQIDTLYQQIQASVHLVPETRIMTLLSNAGFEDATRFYTAFWYGGWVARKRNG